MDRKTEWLPIQFVSRTDEGIPLMEAYTNALTITVRRIRHAVLIVESPEGRCNNVVNERE